MVHFIRTENEEFYQVPESPKKNGEKRRFPSLYGPGTIQLSVIIPAKNEELRLPTMLEECLGYLKRRSDVDSDFTWEIILVDDGSDDGTTLLGLQYSKEYTTEKFRVLTLDHNRGKGGAVRLGVMSARGRHILFADADGATKFSDFEKLEIELNGIGTSPDTKGVICGSRAHLEKESIAKRSILRTILMMGFHLIVIILGGVRNVKDTQCGFKLFSRNTARALFSNLHIERWAFDVELLYLAQRLGMEIREVPVTWQEIEGSKLSPLQASLQMGLDMFFIWFWYLMGSWKIETTSSQTEPRKKSN